MTALRHLLEGVVQRQKGNVLLKGGGAEGEEKKANMYFVSSVLAVINRLFYGNNTGNKCHIPTHYQVMHLFPTRH